MRLPILTCLPLAAPALSGFASAENIKLIQAVVARAGRWWFHVPSFVDLPRSADLYVILNNCH